MDFLRFLWLDQVQQGFLNISAPTLRIECTSLVLIIHIKGQLYLIKGPGKSPRNWRAVHGKVEQIFEFVTKSKPKLWWI